MALGCLRARPQLVRASTFILKAHEALLCVPWYGPSPQVPLTAPLAHPQGQKCSPQDREPETMAPNCHGQDLEDPGEAKLFIYSLIPQKLRKE